MNRPFAKYLMGAVGTKKNMNNSKWDKRFIELAKHVADWSKDPSTKVGAVIVDEYHRIISIGFNGYAKGVLDDDLHNREIKYAKIIHAEINAILFAKRDLSNHTIYTTFVPCPQCAAAIIQSGIKRVVAAHVSNDLFKRWEAKINITDNMFEEASVTLEYI